MVQEGLKNSSRCTSPLNSLAFGANVPEGYGGLGADTLAPGDFSMKITQFQAYLSLNRSFKTYSDDN